MDAFIHQPMMTYLGNKRKLVKYIQEEIEKIQTRLQKPKLDLVDGFCGSVVVARAMVPYAHNLYTNDLEAYSHMMSKCFLEEPDVGGKERVAHHINVMNGLPGIRGVVSENYAPRDAENIQEGERCFYTPENAQRIDAMRKYIEEQVEPELRVYCLVPLLVKASIHANTSGIFKGFYKNRAGVGCYGGEGKNALTRITRKIEVEVPVWSGVRIQPHCHNQDIQKFAEELPAVDVVYLDPPYNQHPYGSNYFMLNTIAQNKLGDGLSKVSGIPKGWNKSDYNYKQKARRALGKLLDTLKTKTKYIILSYNNEGIIGEDEMLELLQPFNWERREIDYNAFRGSRNLAGRSKKVVEWMYLILV